MTTNGGDAYVPPQRIGFRTLTSGEQRGYETLALDALEKLGIRGCAVEQLICHSNVTAKVRRPGLPRLALRMRTGPPVSTRTEQAWLKAVREGTDVATVEPYGGDLAESTVYVAGPDGQPIECSLFVWAEGAPLAARLTKQNYRSLGAMSARLHDFAMTWSPPNGLNPLRWNRTMYYEGTRLVVHDPKYVSLITRRAAESVSRIVKEADRELARIAGNADPIFLHGNIEMWNVMVGKSGDLTLLDFEDVMLGQPILDVAITLYYGTERSDYPELSAAFREGYSSVREWPVTNSRSLALLFAARAAMLLNHALLTEPEPGHIVDRLLPLILKVGE